MLLDLLKLTIQQTKIMYDYTSIDRTPAGNSTYPKVAGQCKYEHLCFKQTLVRIDSLVFQIATFG